MEMEEDDSVEQATAARRERLRALRAAKELLSTPDGTEATATTEPETAAPSTANQKEQEGGRGREDATAEEDPLQTEDMEENGKPNIKFRNYLPSDKQLQEHKIAPPLLPKFEDPVAAAPPIPENFEDPFLNIAPKKPNWDLRRDVQKKLDKLERRTMKALYQIYEQEQKQNLALEEDVKVEDEKDE